MKVDALIKYENYKGPQMLSWQYEQSGDSHYSCEGGLLLLYLER